MIFKTEDFRDVCSSILYAIDSSALATITDTLELVTRGRSLYLNVTNQEYYVSYKFNLDHEEEFHATVNATLFLKLIDKITTEFVELQLQERNILVKANGNYKIPFVTEEETGNLLTVPEIVINNVTKEFPIGYNILSSIMDYNGKDLTNSSLAKEIYTLYYIDQEGCLTHTKSSACITSFTLPQPVSFLLNNRIVKLFKLFKNNPSVQFKIGYDAISDTVIQTKVAFITDNISLTAIIRSDDTLLSQVPHQAIRARGNMNYPNKVILNTHEFADAISRLLLFNDSKLNAKPYSTFNFGIDGNLTIYDSKDDNFEVIRFQPGSELSGPYSMRVDLTDFKKVLDTVSEATITLSCGDNRGGVISRPSVKNIFAQVSRASSNTEPRPQAQ